MRGQGIRMILKSLSILTRDIWRQRKGGKQEGMENEARVERKECWEVTWKQIILLSTAVITEKCKM